MSFKICFPATSSISGGSNNSSYLIAKYLDKNKYHPYFIFPDDGDFVQKVKQDGFNVDVLKLPFSRRDTDIKKKSIFAKGVLFIKLLPYIYLVRRYILDRKINLIHTNDLLSTIIWGLASINTGVPLIWHIRQFKSSPILDRIRLWLSSHVIFVAQQNMRKFSKNILDNLRYSIIYNGVDLSQYNKNYDYSIKDELGISTNTILIGFIGFLVPRKRPEMFVDIACSLLNNNQNLHFVIVGDDPGYSGYKQLIQQQIDKTPFSDNFSILGFRNDVPRILIGIDIFGFTSTSEGEAFPRVVIEAMAAGKPVIATKSAGVVEAVVNGKTGYLVNANDRSGFEERLFDLINNEKKRIEMGNQGRNRAINYFDARKVSRQIEGIYTKLLKTI